MMDDMKNPFFIIIDKLPKYYVIKMKKHFELIKFFLIIIFIFLFQDYFRENSSFHVKGNIKYLLYFASTLIVGWLFFSAIKGLIKGETFKLDFDSNIFSKNNKEICSLDLLSHINLSTFYDGEEISYCLSIFLFNKEEVLIMNIGGLLARKIIVKLAHELERILKIKLISDI